MCIRNPFNWTHSTNVTYDFGGSGISDNWYGATINGDLQEYVKATFGGYSDCVGGMCGLPNGWNIDGDTITMNIWLHDGQWPVPTPTPVPTSTPTPTITPIPHPSFEDCMGGCLKASYQNGAPPIVDFCFEQKSQAGALISCAYYCAPTGPAWPGCVGGCYATTLAICLGVGAVELTAIMTGCAWGCW